MIYEKVFNTTEIFYREIREIRFEHGNKVSYFALYKRNGEKSKK